MSTSWQGGLNSGYHGKGLENLMPTLLFSLKDYQKGHTSLFTFLAYPVLHN